MENGIKIKIEYESTAKSALMVQSACNLKGVIADLPSIRQNLLDRSRQIENYDTEWFNKHPIMYLYSVQIAYLTGALLSAEGEYSKMYGLCERIAKGDIPEGY